MRTIAAIIVIFAAALPALFAGWPGLAPDWFDGRWNGVPAGVVAMCVLMAILMVMARLCSEAAKNRRLPGQGEG